MQAAMNLQLFFFFNDTATTEIYTLSLHDALPISDETRRRSTTTSTTRLVEMIVPNRSEEHTSELQSRSDLVCRLLLEKTDKILLVALPLAAEASDAYGITIKVPT